MEEEKKKQEFQVDENFEVEESNALKVLKAKGEDNVNPHESLIPQKRVGKLENFWYLHKWHIGIGIFILVLAGIVISQMILTKPADAYIMYTGPQPMIGNDYDNLEAAIVEAMGDYNGDGHRVISFTDNTFLTEAEIERRTQEAERIREYNPEYPVYTYDANANNAAYQRFMAEITSGSHMFCMLDPDLYRGLAEQKAFIPVSEIFDEIPEGAEEYGIRLGDTEFYKSNPKLKFIPADTMLAVRVTSTLDMKSSEKKEKQTEANKQLLRDIVEYTAPKED
ncbi:MAG: hypothetical protein E7647_07490 [Ruminococcaceae bacterium]|nr:hypothetical protein [Oscillospiraceae bacterium]